MEIIEQRRRGRNFNNLNGDWKMFASANDDHEQAELQIDKIMRNMEKKLESIEAVSQHHDSYLKGNRNDNKEAPSEQIYNDAFHLSGTLPLSASKRPHQAATDDPYSGYEVIRVKTDQQTPPARKSQPPSRSQQEVEESGSCSERQQKEQQQPTPLYESQAKLLSEAAKKVESSSARRRREPAAAAPAAAPISPRNGDRRGGGNDSGQKNKLVYDQCVNVAKKLALTASAMREEKEVEEEEPHYKVPRYPPRPVVQAPSKTETSPSSSANDIPRKPSASSISYSDASPQPKVQPSATNVTRSNMMASLPTVSQKPSSTTSGACPKATQQPVRTSEMKGTRPTPSSFIKASQAIGPLSITTIGSTTPAYSNVVSASKIPSDKKVTSGGASSTEINQPKSSDLKAAWLNGIDPRLPTSNSFSSDVIPPSTKRVMSPKQYKEEIDVAKSDPEAILGQKTFSVGSGRTGSALPVGVAEKKELRLPFGASKPVDQPGSQNPAIHAADNKDDGFFQIINPQVTPAVNLIKSAEIKPIPSPRRNKTDGSTLSRSNGRTAAGAAAPETPTSGGRSAYECLNISSSNSAHSFLQDDGSRRKTSTQEAEAPRSAGEARK